MQGHWRSVRLLLDAGASIEVGNESNMTPYQLAKLGCHEITVKILKRAHLKLRAKRANYELTLQPRREARLL